MATTERLYTALTDWASAARIRRDVPLMVGTVVAYGVAVYLAISLTRNATHIAAIWPANGILLAALLICQATAARHILVVACIAANAMAGIANGDSWLTLTANALLGPFECALALALLQWTCGARVELTKVWTLVKFVIVCMAAPIVPAVAGAYATMQVFGVSFFEATMTWYLSDTLGLLVITPTILLLTGKSASGVTPSIENVARHFLLLTAVSVIVFVQSSMPLLFLLIPVSVLIAFRLGPRYAAIATLWLTVVSLTSTYQGLGPGALMEDPGTRIWLAQLFCFINLLTSLAVAAELADRDRLQRELEAMSTLASDRRRQLDTALDAMSQGVCLFDRKSRVVVRNSQFLAIYGLSKEAVPTGMTLSALMDVCRQEGAVPEAEGASVELNVNDDIEQQLVNGRHIRISQRVLSDGGVICTYTDYTAEKQAEAELLHRTLHDVLTGLPNRRLLVDRVDQALAAAKRGKNIAVMLLDIDYFKSINDNLGHSAGDHLLKVVSERVKACVRETDTVSRLGGDEFALLLTDGDQTTDAAIVARRILEAVRRPIVIEGKPLRIGMSIGIALPPSGGTTTDDILKSADIALYKAKRSGRGRYAFFDTDEDAGVSSARRLESELRRGIDEKQFRVVYQPITRGASSSIAAIEALIRWDHPELGTIAPAEFIPIAERNGLISEIGDWVLEQACRDAASLPSNVKVSVNLSRIQVCDRKLPGRVAMALARTGLPPARLELEVTETAVLDNETVACQVLEDLCALGVSVAIDDFGVGQSALSCLKTLPIGRIKIDRSFISDIVTDSKARAILVAVVSLAKSLGIQTTAEGIETEQQRSIAALSGCDNLQGYLLGRPQDLSGLESELTGKMASQLLLDIAV